MNQRFLLSCVCVLSMFLSVTAAECRRGELAEGYCDRNLDMVADLPLDVKNG